MTPEIDVDFEYSDKCNNALSQLRDFMDEPFYPNDVAYQKQHECGGAPR